MLLNDVGDELIEAQRGVVKGRFACIDIGDDRIGCAGAIDAYVKGALKQ